MLYLVAYFRLSQEFPRYTPQLASRGPFRTSSAANHSTTSLALEEPRLSDYGLAVTTRRVISVEWGLCTEKGARYRKGEGREIHRILEQDIAGNF
jgi:hypothetical protein